MSEAVVTVIPLQNLLYVKLKPKCICNFKECSSCEWQY